MKTYNNPFEVTHGQAEAAVMTIRTDLVIKLARFIKDNPEQELIDKGAADQIAKGESSMSLEGLIGLAAMAGLNPTLAM